MQKDKKKKKWTDYIWNALFALIILILLIPSWRVAFQGTIQRLFMTSVKLEETMNESVTFKGEDWIIYDVNNDPISFQELNDKPIVLNFWATWCPPCIAELPGLYEFYEALEGHAYVVAVSDQNLEKLIAFDAFKKYPGMIYNSKKQSKYFQFSSYPTTFIMAPNFRIVTKIVGAENFATSHNIEFIKNLK